MNIICTDSSCNQSVARTTKFHWEKISLVPSAAQTTKFQTCQLSRATHRAVLFHTYIQRWNNGKILCYTVYRENNDLGLQVNFQLKKIEGTDQKLTKNSPRRFFSMALVPLTHLHHRLNTLR